MEGFRGDKCRECGGTFDWGGDRRKEEHLKCHAAAARDEKLTQRTAPAEDLSQARQLAPK